MAMSYISLPYLPGNWKGPSPRRSQDKFAAQLSLGIKEHGSMLIETLCLLLLCPDSPANRVQLPNIPQVCRSSNYAGVLTSDSDELPKLSTKSNCVVCWSFR